MWFRNSDVSSTGKTFKAIFWPTSGLKERMWLAIMDPRISQNIAMHVSPSARGFFIELIFSFLVHSRGGELRFQELKSHLVRTQSLNVLPLKPGVGQYIAIHATPTAFLAYFYHTGPSIFIFLQNLSRFLLYRLLLTHASCVGPQNKIGHPAGSRFPCWMPAEHK